MTRRHAGIGQQRRGSRDAKKSAAPFEGGGAPPETFRIVDGADLVKDGADQLVWVP